MKIDDWKKEDIAEDYCFTCKDGGLLRVCDFNKCLKAYHPHCVEKDNSFLESDERWTCGWHSCLICKKSSTFQCFGCPRSFCRSCIKSAEFVQVKKKTKGFCNNCLRLIIMLEEGKDIDSDGGQVDLTDTETYEVCFKDYWEIVKEQEGLTLVDLHAAVALFKRGENCQSRSGSDKEELMSEDDGEEDNFDGLELFKGLKGKRSRTRTPQKKYKSKKRTFVGWGSQELIEFLTSIGKDTEKPLAQVDVCEIVKDYFKTNNLYQPDKKKKRKQIVVCDDRTFSLFRKRKLKPYKIFDLLESHFADSIDFGLESSFSSEEDGGGTFARKQQKTDTKIQKSDPRKSVLEQPKSCYAAIVASNIKLVYLKRSLISDLLQNPETFEDKVLGSFVRVKNDPKDFYYSPQNIYRLGQVTGIKKAQQSYKLGETTTDVVLCISNLSKDIHIYMLSDDDFEEEELEDVRQLVKRGLFKRPTIAELDRKLRIVHEDITNHWINRELVKLQKQIDRANEKGWRRELHEYIDRREQLRSAEERMRLLKEIPEIIADMEVERKAPASPPSDFCKEYKVGNNIPFGENGAGYLEKAVERKNAGNEVVTSENGVISLGKVAEAKDGGNEVVIRKTDAVSHEIVPITKHEDHDDQTNEYVDEDAAGGISEAPIAQKPLDLGNEVVTSENGVASLGKVAETKDGDDSLMKEDCPASHEEGVAEKLEEHEAQTNEYVNEDAARGSSEAPIVQRPQELETKVQSKSSDIPVIEIEDEEVPTEKKPSEVEIINLDEDDEDLQNALQDKAEARIDAPEEIVQEIVSESHEIWHYIDPSGDEQGPFSLTSLRKWREAGFFDEDFKVWRIGQSREDAILLIKALSLAFSR